jgi:hypothetical protein
MISWPYCLRALLLLSMWFILVGKSPNVHADDIGVLEQQVYDLINSHRRSIGLNPLIAACNCLRPLAKSPYGSLSDRVTRACGSGS